MRSAPTSLRTASRSSIESAVVYRARRGPICAAQARTARSAWASVRALLSAPIARQLSGPDRPVPRASNTTSSRSRRTGASDSAKSDTSATAPCPGPPLIATTTPRRGRSGGTRATRRPIRPGRAPERSSGTGSVAQRAPGRSGQGAKRGAAPASGAVQSRPAARRASGPARRHRLRPGPATALLLRRRRGGRADAQVSPARRGRAGHRVGRRGGRSLRWARPRT